MKKSIFIVVMLLVVILPLNVEAQRGCCSHHGGVSGCSSNGRQVCNDGTLSPSCTCTPSYIYGCTDSSAKNYNSSANKDNGSCTYYVMGCTDSSAKNYNSSANKNDGSCSYYVMGCTDSNSINYDSKAEKDNGSCIKKVLGCMDEKSLNYNKEANVSDDSCKYKEEVVVTSSKKSEPNRVSENKKESSEPSDIGAGIVGLGIIGASVYFIRKKVKKQ